MGMTPEKWAEIEAAAEARAGGNAIRAWAAARDAGPIVKGEPQGRFRLTRRGARKLAQAIARGRDMSAVWFPEAAFDWPVYRAAMAGSAVKHG